MSDPVNIVTGHRPDGTPWVIGVDFDAGVRVDAYGRIWLGRKQVSVDDAEAKAAALIVAARWVRNDESSKLEAEMAKEKGDMAALLKAAIRAGGGPS